MTAVTGLAAGAGVGRVERSRGLENQDRFRRRPRIAPTSEVAQDRADQPAARAGAQRRLGRGACAGSNQRSGVDASAGLARLPLRARFRDWLVRVFDSLDTRCFEFL